MSWRITSDRGCSFVEAHNYLRQVSTPDQADRDPTDGGLLLSPLWTLQAVRPKISANILCVHPAARRYGDLSVDNSLGESIRSCAFDSLVPGVPAACLVV